MIQSFTPDFLIFSAKHHFVWLTKYPVGGKVAALHIRRLALYLNSVVTLNQSVWVSCNNKMKNIGSSCISQSVGFSCEPTVIPLFESGAFSVQLYRLDAYCLWFQTDGQLRSFEGNPQRTNTNNKTTV